MEKSIRKKIYLLLNHLDRQFHWVLEVFVVNDSDDLNSEKNLIYVFDSLKCYTLYQCLFKESYSNVKVFGILDIQLQTDLDCGYWSMYYAFIIYYLLNGIENIVEVIPILSKYFIEIKSIIQLYYKKALELKSALKSELKKERKN